MTERTKTTGAGGKDGRTGGRACIILHCGMLRGWMLWMHGSHGLRHSSHGARCVDKGGRVVGVLPSLCTQNGQASSIQSRFTYHLPTYLPYLLVHNSSLYYIFFVFRDHAHKYPPPPTHHLGPRLYLGRRNSPVPKKYQKSTYILSRGCRVFSVVSGGGTYMHMAALRRGARRHLLYQMIVYSKYTPTGLCVLQYAYIHAYLF